MLINQLNQGGQKVKALSSLSYSLLKLTDKKRKKPSRLVVGWLADFLVVGYFINS